MVQGLIPKYVVAVTGTFGSGKSTAAREFEKLGAYYADADALAHKAMKEDPEVRAKLRALFPEAVEEATGAMDRKKLARVVFSDRARREALEKVIHPYVFENLRAMIAAAEEKIAVLEVPLLYESGFDRECDCSVVVKASEEVILKRLAEKGFSPEEVASRMKAQMPLEEKIARADFIVENTGDTECLEKQIKKIWKKINQRKGAT